MSTWEELRQECLNCRKCGLCQTRTNVVFGVGKEDAEVMFIGEGPGQQEDLKGEPFVGRSGQLLDKLMATVDLFRNKNIYIANTVKCRPPQNRDPLPEEQEACSAWLDRQIALMRPKIIVCVGRISAQRYISKDFASQKSTDFSMTATVYSIWVLSIPRRCSAIPTRSPRRSRILLPCATR